MNPFVQKMTIACGCSYTIKLESTDGDFRQDRTGDKIGFDHARCPMHDLAEKMWQLLDEAETDTRQRAFPDKDWHAKARDILERIKK